MIVLCGVLSLILLVLMLGVVGMCVVCMLMMKWCFLMVFVDSCMLFSISWCSLVLIVVLLVFVFLSVVVMW